MSSYQQLEALWMYQSTYYVEMCWRCWRFVVAIFSTVAVVMISWTYIREKGSWNYFDLFYCLHVDRWGGWKDGGGRGVPDVKQDSKQRTKLSTLQMFATSRSFPSLDLKTHHKIYPQKKQLLENAYFLCFQTTRVKLHRHSGSGHTYSEFLLLHGPWVSDLVFFQKKTQFVTCRILFALQRTSQACLLWTRK